MRSTLVVVATLALGALSALVPGFRPPCVPLNVVSPYQSTWSCHDTLNGGWPTHWNGQVIGMTGFISVDKSNYGKRTERGAYVAVSVR